MSANTTRLLLGLLIGAALMWAFDHREEITAYVGGSTTLTATLETGGTAVCRWIPNNGYTPAVNHYGLVLVTPSANWWLGQDSIP